MPKDLSQAVKWYHKAADQGNNLAEHKLESMHSNGKGLPKDAVKWYSRTAEQGNVRAQYYLGLMYTNDQEGLHRDYVQALKWLYSAKAGGFVKADRVIQWVESRISNQQIERPQALAAKWRDNHHQ